MFLLTNNRVLEKINLNDYSFCDGDISFNTSHLIVKKICDNYSLIVDTFNDVQLVVGTQDSCNLMSNQKEIDHSKMIVFKNLFSLEGWIDKAQIRYRDDINKKQEEGLLEYQLCATYDCNMRCIYCYQQHNKCLDRKNISDENIELFFNHVEKSVAESKNNLNEKNKDKKVVIHLFGGEPLQKKSYAMIEKVLKFCRKNKFYIAMTTNGLDIDHFMPLIIPYRGYIARVGTTLDGTRDFHNKRRIPVEMVNSYDKITQNINYLLALEINTTVSINIDKSNIAQLPDFMNMVKDFGWSEHPKFKLEIGRVDDRTYDTDYKAIFSEASLLSEIVALHEKKLLPDNFYLAALKTSLYLAKKVGLSFNQNESGRALYHYCWSTSPTSNIQYVDADLDVFRCTYTVGKKEYSCGNLKTGYSMDEWFSHRLFDLDDCMKCPLGGYCSGGCRLSSEIDKKRQCEYELKNFDQFLDEIFIPQIKKFMYV